MDGKSIKTQVVSVVKKYRYPLLILLVGILFMAIPQKEASQDVSVPVSEEETKMDMQQALEDILCKIEGVGRVEVLLTQSAGEEIIYQNDTDDSSDAASTDTKQNTVIISDSSRSEQPVVRQILPPTYLGAVIVCQGGDSPVVRLAIVEAVANATGLSADKITVLKMK